MFETTIDRDMYDHPGEQTTMTLLRFSASRRPVRRRLVRFVYPYVFTRVA